VVAFAMTAVVDDANAPPSTTIRPRAATSRPSRVAPVRSQIRDG
jgi:hypothetical protein